MDAAVPGQCGPRLWLASAVFSAALLAAGCDKAKVEPAPVAATVIMPGTQAPSDAAASSNMPPVAVTVPPPAAVDATGNAPSTGGTVSVLPAAPTAGTTTIVVVNPPQGTTAPAASTPPISPTVSVLPPAISASAAGPISIGPNLSPGSSDQPQSFAPGTPPPTPQR